jgi:von Willebrand factor type A domain
MRRPNRQLAVFTMSALDVLAMSTGVFVLLLVLLMPYYRREHDANAEIQGVRAAQAETIARVEAIDRTATLWRDEASAAEAEAARLNAAAAALEAAAAEQRRRVPAPEGGAEEERGGDIETPIVRELDLVFVVDTTASMTPVLQEIAVSLGSIVRILESLVPSVRVGFVSYKDRDTGLPPVVAFPLTPADRDLERIVAFIERLSASPIGSTTIEEDVHLGLAAAVAMPFRRDAKQAIVVVGDAEAHAYAKGETFARAMGFAQASERRSLSTLFVSTPSSMRAGNRARPFFTNLARAGRGEFNDHTGSMIESVLLSVLVE